MVRFYAVESIQRFYIISERVMEGTLSGLLKHYFDQGYISPAQYASKRLEIKLVVRSEQLVPFPIFSLLHVVNVLYKVPGFRGREKHAVSFV